jgi:protein-tyrosine-phosphatase
MTDKIKVLFVDVHNSARSRIAEQLDRVREVREAIREHVEAWLRTHSYDVMSNHRKG